ncbi:MAG: hypothetical protein IPK26_26050 [Planctomycetes bacterium]|nr:hypothetical protein [Planctomycetota bacterium]
MLANDEVFLALIATATSANDSVEKTTPCFLGLPEDVVSLVALKKMTWHGTLTPSDPNASTTGSPGSAVGIWRSINLFGLAWFRLPNKAGNMYFSSRYCAPVMMIELSKALPIVALPM